MPSLVLELQRDAVDPTASLSVVLRTALAVAAKLDVPEFYSLCERELGGYGEAQPPEYRKVRGEVKAHSPYHGWQPLPVEDPESARRLSEVYVKQSVGELEDLLGGGNDAGVLQVAFPPELLHQWADKDFMQMGLVPTLIISRTALLGIIERVRYLILDWSLRLEKEGVLGDGMTFSRGEKENAASVVYNIQSVTGVVGGSVQAENLDISSFSSVHTELKRLGIDQRSRNELATVMDELPGASGEAKVGLLQQGLDWVKRNKEALGALNSTIVAWLNSQH